MYDNVNPTLVNGMAAYYLGRPNTLFLDRYRTIEHRSLRPLSIVRARVEPDFG